MRSSARATSTGSTRPGSRCSAPGRRASGRPSWTATPNGSGPTMRAGRQNRGAGRGHRKTRKNYGKARRKYRNRRDCPMPDQPAAIEPVRKTVTVPASPQRAFELFTAGISEWWPLATHSVGQDQAAGVVFGEGVGGEITESLADGTASVWGTGTRWEPPRLVAYTWHAGTPAAEASSVEGTFTPGGLAGSPARRGWGGPGPRPAWGPALPRPARAARAAAGMCVRSPLVVL